MSSKLWLGKDDGKGFSTRATANKFLVQRGLLGGQVTRGPDGRWFIDMTGQHIPKEYAHRVIGSPEAIKRATMGRPWENNDSDPIEEESSTPKEREWSEIFEDVDKIKAEVQAQERKAAQPPQKRSKKSKAASSTSALPEVPQRPLAPYAQPDGSLNTDMLAQDFDVKTLESLLQDKDLTAEEKSSLREVRAGLIAEAQYQKVQDTLSDKESWQLQSQQKVDSRSYDAYNKRVGTLNPLEALQQQLRGQMEDTAQRNFDNVLRSQKEASQRENNIGLAMWRQQQMEEKRTAEAADKAEARAAKQIERDEVKASTQENNIGLAMWRQRQMEERRASELQAKEASKVQVSAQREEAKAATQENNIGLAMWRQQQREAEKEDKFFQSEEERYDSYWQNPEHESVMDKLRGRIMTKTERTNQDSIQRLIESLSELSEEVDENTEQLEEANEGGTGGKGSKGGKKEDDDKEGGGIASAISAVMKPLMVVLETIGAVGFAAANNAKRELVGSNTAGLSRQHYAGLINKLGIGTDLGGQLVSNASNSVIGALRNPDSIASSLEQALTANALLGGPQLDAAAIVKAQLSGDTAGLMNVMQQYNKQASPMQVAAVSGVYGQNLAALSNAEGFSTEDEAVRTGVDEQVWRGLERFNLVITNTLGGDFEEAAGQTKAAVVEVASGMNILADSMKRAFTGISDYSMSSFKWSAGEENSQSLSDKVQSTSGNTSFSDSVSKALTDVPVQSEEEGDYILQEDGGHLDKESGLVNYALEAERNQAHLIRATNNTTTQKVEVVANVAVQGHMTTDDGRAIPLKPTGKEVKVTGAGETK